jgi:hypothetical protein
MGMIYEKIFRPVLFRQDSERAHEHGVNAMALLAKLAPLRRALELYSRLDAGRFRPREGLRPRISKSGRLGGGFRQKTPGLGRRRRRWDLVMSKSAPLPRSPRTEIRSPECSDIRPRKP